jgi:type IV pilus assembly protein PilY1
VPYDTDNDRRIDEHDDAIIYVGTNGGVMHAFLDSSGEELWGLIPPKQLGRLKRLSDERMGHGYAIDGPPVVFDSEIDGALRKTLVFGERRGGGNYYALDITVYDRPIWKYCIGDDILGKNAERLGQSWGRPQLATVATGSESTADVLLIAGGYDTQQDSDKPKESDQRGRAVFSVIADSGVLGPFKFYNDGRNSDMTHSIVDVVGIDSDGDGVIGSIYAPDLGGNMFVFTDHDKNGVWKKLRLFNASSDTQRKIFFSPDVIRIIGDPDPDDQTEEEKVGEMIFFGTGDRAHPKETKCKNRFYGVKNYDWDSDFDTLSDRIAPNGDGDLHDATGNTIIQGASLEAQQRALVEIKKRMGWFIDLEAEGEKVVSTPVIYNRTVYFTTYVPPISDGTQEDDDCDAEVENGEARLYGLNYYDGRAVHDDWSDIKEFDPVTQKEIKSGGKADRYISIGSSMPSAPLMVIRNGIARLYIGVGGRLLTMMPKQAIEMNMYYWREINGALKGKP